MNFHLEKKNNYINSLVCLGLCKIRLNVQNMKESVKKVRKRTFEKKKIWINGGKNWWKNSKNVNKK